MTKSELIKALEIIHVDAVKLAADNYDDVAAELETDLSALIDRVRDEGVQS